MSVFTAEDLAEMAAGGNAAHNAVYLGRHQRDHTLPNGSDIIKLKEFIRLKYVDKKWHTGGDGGGGGELRRPSVSGWGAGSSGASAAPAPAANVPSAFVRVRVGVGCPDVIPVMLTNLFFPLCLSSVAATRATRACPCGGRQ